MKNLLIFGLLDNILLLGFKGRSDYSIAMICIQAGLLSAKFFKENYGIEAFISVTTIISMFFNAILLQTPLMYVAAGCSFVLAMKTWWSCIISGIGVIFISLRTDVMTICEILAFLSTAIGYLLYLRYVERLQKADTVITSSKKIAYKFPLDLGTSPKKEFEHTEFNIFKKLLSAFPDGVLILDENQAIQFSNAAFKNIMNENLSDLAKNKLLSLKNAINSEQDNYKQLFLILDKKIKSRSKSLNGEKNPDYYTQLKSSIDQEPDEFNHDMIQGEENYNLSYAPVIQEEVKQLFHQMLNKQPKLDGATMGLKFFQEISIVCQGDLQQIFQVILKPYIAFTKAYILFIIRDITHVNQIAALEKMNFNKSQMLAKVAHEFKTPLNIIIQQASDIQQNNGTGQKAIEKRVQPIKSMAASLLGLVNDLLDVAQLKAGKFNLQFQQVRVTELLNEIIDVMKIQANNKGLYMKLEHNTKVPYMIRTDPNRLKQVILNLLSNAIKFTETGGITISTLFDGEFLELSVKDTGIGIPKNEQSKLFTAFGRLENSDNITGVGLGLMISNILAQKLGQEIKVQSEGEDQGSIFSFKINCGKPQTQQSQVESENYLSGDDDEGSVNTLRRQSQQSQMQFKYNRMQSPDQTICRCPQVLVVDDVPFNIQMLENQLKTTDIRIDKAYSAKEAMNKIENFHGCDTHSTYRIVLLDVEMPIINGYQALKMIRERADTQIIACSAYGKDELDLSSFDGYLGKPIKVDQLQQLIKNGQLC